MTRYDGDYYRRTFGLDDLRRFNMHWWSVRFYANIARRLLRRSPGRRFLEIGCAHGYTLARLERDGETWGVDISAYALERARTVAPRARVFEADIEAALPPEIERGGFDVILAKYVLEHLHDPARALVRLGGLLVPGGVLLYSVPELRSPGRRFKGRDWYAYKDETHVSLLEADEWLRITAAAGFTVERAFADGLWDMPYLKRVPRLLQYGIFAMPTVATVGLAVPLLPAGFGENLIVVARRPVS